jgi:hypothetical protein
VSTRFHVGKAVKAAGCVPFELTLQKEGPPTEVRIGVMHLTNGLEFKTIGVIGCDEDQLPLRSRVEAVADRREAALLHCLVTARQGSPSEQ